MDTCLGVDILTDSVAYFQSVIFEQLEHLYIPLFVRFEIILNSVFSTCCKQERKDNIVNQCN